VNIKRSNINPQKLTFSGHNKKLDKFGYQTHSFFYLYDTQKYNCEVELYNLEKDNKGNFSVSDKVTSFPLEKGKIDVDVDSIPDITSKEGFAYRFKLTDKTTGKKSYAFDNGSVIGIFDNNQDNKYNVVLNNRATINKNGPMQLIMPDEYYPGIINQDGKPTYADSLRAKALASVRNHANKLGGNFYGIIERLPELEKEGVKRIVGTPFTKDSISSHLYWTENAYRVAPNLGTEEEFKTLQEELCKHGINWVADAALVNEGFGGIHLSELLRKGSDSFSKNLFRAEEKISLGVLPDKCDYTRMKVINAPFVITSAGSLQTKNPEYDASKPTYIQFYDDRLASDEQKASNSPARLTTYDNKNTDNIYDITRHDDAVYPFYFEVSPSELSRNMSEIYKKQGKIDLSDIETIKQAANFTNFNVVNKSAAGGLEVWDGNVDIAKLNFYRADKDNERFAKLPEYMKQSAKEDFEKGALAVRDYALNSGKYWTKLSSDTQLEYVSNQLGSVSPSMYSTKIKALVAAGQLPKSTLDVVDSEVINAVINGDYHSRLIDDADTRSDINPESYLGNDYYTEDYILKHAMDVPLETLPVATNLLGILTSPYIAKKANTEDELGVSRFDTYSAHNPNLPEKYEAVYSEMDAIYKDDVAPIIKQIVNDIEGISEDNEVTPYGKYVLNEIVPDLTKYLLLKAIAPSANVSISEDGKFDFSKVNEEAITMQSLGIPYEGQTLEQEATKVVKVIKDGLTAISDDEIASLQEKVAKRFENRDENSFRISEMILDRTESGLGWRIDAAKDIASIDSVRADVDSMTDAWNNVIDFWKRYNDVVLAENPHAYTTAEITDLYDLFKDEGASIFTSDADAERKFLEETGITSVANYNFFFSLLPDLFAPLKLEGFDDPNGWQANESKNFRLLDKMDKGWGENPGFLFQSPDDGVVNSYTFVGNHDKPRMLHLLSLNPDLFTSDFSNPEHQKIAAKVLGKNQNSINYDDVNSMAVAMGARLNEAFETVVKDKAALAELKQAVSELASGSHKGKNFDATAFGTRPLEIAIQTVFDQVEFNGSSIPNAEIVKAKTLENVLTPAFDRFYSIYKLLITLPGSPTDFAGDKLGLTGFETKAKNYHQQNRNVINWEWLEKPEYAFVKKFYKNMNSIASLRTHKKLSALNDGSTVTMKVLDRDAKSPSEKVQALLRYNDEGSIVLSFHNSTGSNSPQNALMDRVGAPKTPQAGDVNANVISDKNDRIVLFDNPTNPKSGLKHGLKEGMVFYNAKFINDVKDKEQYVVSLDKKTGEYYLQKKVKNARGIYDVQPTVIEPEEFNTLVLYKA